MNRPPGAWRGTIPEFLRANPELPDVFRTPFALLAGAGLLHGSTLGECIEAGELPPETLDVIRAGLVLRQLGAGAAAWEGLREALGYAAGVVGLQWPGTGILLPEEDPDTEAFRAVDARLAAFEAAAREAEGTIRSAGYAWRDGAIVRPNGANPRALYRDVLDALLQARGAKVRNDRDTREWLASELAPLPFPPALLDPTSGGKMDETVRNVLRLRKAKRRPSR